MKKFLSVFLLYLLFLLYNPVCSAEYDTKKFEKFYNKASVSLKSKNYDSALTNSEKAILINDDSDAAYAIKAEALRYLKNYKESKTTAQKALKLNPDNYLANTTLGTLFLLEDDDEKALMHLNKALSINPQFAKALINRAGIYVKKHNYEKAIKDVNAAISLTTEYDAAFYNRALSYINLKQYEKALDDLNRIIEKNPKNTDYIFARSECYVYLNNIPLALADSNKIVKLQPKNSSSYFKRLSIYSKINASDKLISNDLKLAEKYVVSSEDELTTLMDYYGFFKKYSDSSRIANKILMINYKNVNAIFTKANNAAALKDYTSALKYYDQITQITQNLPTFFYCNRGMAKLGAAGLNNESLIKSAIDDLNKSIELKENVSNSYLYRGSAHVALNNYKLGTADLNHYINLVESPDILAYYQLAWSYFHMNNRILSNKYYKKIIDLNMNEVPAMINILSLSDESDLKTDYIELAINALLSKNIGFSQLANHANPPKYVVSPYVNALGDKTTNTMFSTMVLETMRYFSVIDSILYNKKESKQKLNTFLAMAPTYDVFYLSEIVNKLSDYDDTDLLHDIINYLNMRQYEDANRNQLANETIAIAYLKLADFAQNNDSAINYYETALSYSNDPKVKSLTHSSMAGRYAQLASQYFEKGEYFKSVEFYTKAINTKNTPSYYAQRAEAKHKMRDYDGALSDYNRALGYNKNLYWAYFGRASLYFDLNKYSLALNDYRKYAQHYPSDANGYYNCGVCLYNMGQKQSALTYLNKAKNLYQKSSDSSNYNSCVNLINKIKGYKRDYWW